MNLEEFLKHRAPNPGTTQLTGFVASIIHGEKGNMVLKVHAVELRDGQRLSNSRHFLVKGDTVTDLDAPRSLATASES